MTSVQEQMVEQMVYFATVRPIHVDIIGLLMDELVRRGLLASSFHITDRLGDFHSNPIYKLTIRLDKIDNPLILPIGIQMIVNYDVILVRCSIDAWHIGLNKSVPLADPLVFEKTCDIILDHIELRREIEANNDVTLANRF